MAILWQHTAFMYVCIWQLPFGLWWECRWVRNCFISWLADLNVSQIKLCMIWPFLFFLFLSLDFSSAFKHWTIRVQRRQMRKKTKRRIATWSVPFVCRRMIMSFLSKIVFASSRSNLTDCYYWRKDVHELWCLIWVFRHEKKTKKKLTRTEAFDD